VGSLLENSGGMLNTDSELSKVFVKDTEVDGSRHSDGER
jgi:hypothetical protein